MKKTSNHNLANYNNNNNTPNNNNSFSSQLSEYAIQRSFNEQIQDKSDGNADSDCSVNFQSRKREYKPSKNNGYKTNENFSTKKSFVSHYPSTENFHSKNTLGDKLGSEHYIAPRKNRAGYTKEDYISDKNEIENMFTNSKNLLLHRSGINNVNTNNTNSELNNSMMNTNNFLGTSMASVNNLGTNYNNNNNNQNQGVNSAGNINIANSSNSYLKRSLDRINNYNNNNNNKNEMDNHNSNFYNNTNNSFVNTNKLTEIKEEHELGAKEFTEKDSKLRQNANHFLSENPHDDDSWNCYGSRKFDVDSNNNFQSNFLYENKGNRSILNYNNNSNNNHLSNNDLDILEKIKINSQNDSYYYNYDSDPK